MSNLIMALLLVKHFLADFPLQTVYMLGKGKKGLDWILPLGAHCTVHMVLTGMILTIFAPTMLWLAVVEFGAHFVIDRIKATRQLPTGTWAPEDKGKYLSKYYFAFGLDQLAHGLTYVWIVQMVSS